MEPNLEFTAGKAMLYSIKTWFLKEVIVFSTLCQFIVVVAICFLAYFAARRLQPWLRICLSKNRWIESHLEQFTRVLIPLCFQTLALLLLWFSVGIADILEQSHHIISIATSLLGAWIAIRFTSNLVRNETWSRMIAVFAWTLAALNTVKLLHPTIVVLDSIAFKAGDMRISILTVFKGMVLLAILLRVATAFSTFLERRIQSVPNLTPSVQVLLVKLLKVSLLTIAVVVSLSSIGINLTAFAVFSGAIGVGVGFGLQKVVSNLVSGIILLLDKSIKPGDVIEIGHTYGWITSLGARYVSLETRDGREYLIPNEDLITQQVVNWSYSNDLVRVNVPMGVSYDSDVHKVMELILNAASQVRRVLEQPKPICLIKGFGDSSIDLELRIWISDPKNGVSNVRSDVLLAVWEKFKEHNIEIPFPQRDLHLKYPATLNAMWGGKNQPSDDDEYEMKSGCGS